MILLWPVRDVDRWLRLPVRLLAVLGLHPFLMIEEFDPSLSLGVIASLIKGLGLWSRFSLQWALPVCYLSFGEVLFPQ